MKRDYLNLMSLSFESVSTLGNSYNQNPANRARSTRLKNELQGLIDKSKMNFNFDKELREF